MLDDIFGPARLLRDADTYYCGSKRNRTARSAPKVSDEIKHLGQPIVPSESIFGWTWCGNTDGSSKTVGVVVRSYIAEIVTLAMDPDHKLKPYEQQTLDSFYMRDASGQRRLVFRYFWFRWLGHETLVTVKLFDRLWPCHQQIYPTTGAPARPGEGEPCGQARYCENCAKVLRLLGQSWDVRVWTDYINMWLRTIIAKWTQTADANTIEWPLCKQEHVHECSACCQHSYRRAGSAGA